ncbi:MAG: hypothetical protein M1830_007780 [Pleopsidium flavum]|nr:MAG: hypothetical protein M1830_007780 [Pleopsidium flavum]
MAVRMEQRAMETSIQELNYKITVALNSDSKGEVEGLRWVLTRRAALAISLAITSYPVLILSSLRYSTYKLHAREQARKLASTSSTSSSSTGTGGGGGGNFTVPSREAGTQTGESAEMLANLNSGSSPSYVSLG